MTNRHIPYHSISEFFRKKRLVAGLTQGTLASKIGVHVQIVSNWERGLCKPPLGRLSDVAEILHIPKAEIVNFLLREQELLLRGHLGLPVKNLEKPSQ